MVGQAPLERRIGVQIPAPQLKQVILRDPEQSRGIRSIHLQSTSGHCIIFLMGYELSRAYFEYLGDRITNELTDGKSLDGREWGTVLSVSSCIYINQGLGKITLEQAEELYQKIHTLFPHLKERLQSERERGFRPPAIESSHKIGESGKKVTGANIQTAAENQKVRPLPVDLEDLV